MSYTTPRPPMLIDSKMKVDVKDIHDKVNKKPVCTTYADFVKHYADIEVTVHNIKLSVPEMVRRICTDFQQLGTADTANLTGISLLGHQVVADALRLSVTFDGKVGKLFAVRGPHYEERNSHQSILLSLYILGEGQLTFHRPSNSRFRQHGDTIPHDVWQLSVYKDRVCVTFGIPDGDDVYFEDQDEDGDEQDKVATGFMYIDWETLINQPPNDFFIYGKDYETFKRVVKVYEHRDVLAPATDLQRKMTQNEGATISGKKRRPNANAPSDEASARRRKNPSTNVDMADVLEGLNKITLTGNKRGPNTIDEANAKVGRFGGRPKTITRVHLSKKSITYYQAHTVKELQAMAKARGIVFSRLLKADLIKALM